MNAPQHFPTPSGVHDVRLSAQDAHLRLKLFNKDNVLEQRLARAWGLAGEIIPPVAQQFWEGVRRSEEHTSELQSLMRISYAVFCLKKKKTPKQTMYNISSSIYRTSNLSRNSMYLSHII